MFVCFAGRLKVNIGNIYFKQRNYPKAIKYYRMALDQVPNTHKRMRWKLLYYAYTRTFFIWNST